MIPAVQPMKMPAFTSILKGKSSETINHLNGHKSA